MLCLLMTLCTIYILMIVKVIDLCFIDMFNIKFKVQSHLLKESSKLNINLQRQDRIYYIWQFLCHEDQEKLKIPKWVIRSRKSKMDRQFNGQKKDKRTNSDLLNITQNTKDRVTRTSLYTGSNLMCFGIVNSYCSTCGTRRVTLVPNKMISHEWGKNRIVIRTNGTYPLSTVTQILRNI